MTTCREIIRDNYCCTGAICTLVNEQARSCVKRAVGKLVGHQYSHTARFERVVCLLLKRLTGDTIRTLPGTQRASLKYSVPILPSQSVLPIVSLFSGPLA